MAKRNKDGRERKTRVLQKQNNLPTCNSMIADFNIQRTGCASHKDTYFDENGNKRTRFVPNTIYFEALKGGLVFYRVCNDGASFMPLTNTSKPISYRNCIEAIELLTNTHKAQV